MEFTDSLKSEEEVKGEAERKPTEEGSSKDGK